MPVRDLFRFVCLMAALAGCSASSPRSGVQSNGAALPPANGPVPSVPAGEPGFTPMTVTPSLLNAPEVQQALIREYPAVLRDAGIGGAPVLWIHIGESGVVDDARIQETSGFEALDAAAMAVARGMRFSPAYYGAQVTAAWVQIPIPFQVVK